jgi:hypothetical protein
MSKNVFTIEFSVRQKNIVTKEEIQISVEVPVAGFIFAAFSI